MSCRFALSVSTVSSFVPVQPWQHQEPPPLTDPTVQISRSGFLKPDSLCGAKGCSRG